MHGIVFRGGLVIAVTLLSACADDLLGHPGERAPGAAQGAWSAQARSLVRTELASLPSPAVDLAAWAAPAAHSGVLGRWLEAATRDAGRPDRADSLRRAQAALPLGVQAVVAPPMLDDRAEPTWTTASDWPAQFVEVATVDAALAEHIASLDGPVVLVGCPASANHLDACLQTVATRPDTWMTLDGALHRTALPDTLMRLLQRADLYPRYKWASRWPAPAVNWNIWLQPLVEHGFLAADDVTALREIYAYNPLAFQIVLLRRLRLPGTQLALPPSIFSGLPAGEADDA